MKSDWITNADVMFMVTMETVLIKIVISKDQNHKYILSLYNYNINMHLLFDDLYYSLVNLLRRMSLLFAVKIEYCVTFL